MQYLSNLFLCAMRRYWCNHWSTPVLRSLSPYSDCSALRSFVNPMWISRHRFWRTDSPSDPAALCPFRNLNSLVLFISHSELVPMCTGSFVTEEKDQLCGILTFRTVPFNRLRKTVCEVNSIILSWKVQLKNWASWTALLDDPEWVGGRISYPPSLRSVFVDHCS